MKDRHSLMVSKDGNGLLVGCMRYYTYGTNSLLCATQPMFTCMYVPGLGIRFSVMSTMNTVT